MNRSELESKHLAELHVLAAEAGIERYRMLSRSELVERLADGGGGDGRRESSSRERSRPPRQRRERGERRPRERRGPKPSEEKPSDAREPSAAPEAAAAPGPEQRPKRRRRRRRFGRRARKTVQVNDLLLPPEGGRQTIVYGESRQACTALLREIAADISTSKGPDPIGLLIDPSPEELADWKREAPKAEIVSAGQARHADDAIGQALRRAESGEDVFVLIDSLSRFAESFGDSDEARILFDAGRGIAVGGSGSLTVVAALERPA